MNTSHVESSSTQRVAQNPDGDTIGIRALKQNASAVVSIAAQGHTITVTDRGREVAQIVPLATSPVERLMKMALARPARRSWSDLPAPLPSPSTDDGSALRLSEAVIADRADERY